MPTLEGLGFCKAGGICLKCGEGAGFIQFVKTVKRLPRLAYLGQVTCISGPLPTLWDSFMSALHPEGRGSVDDCPSQQRQ